MKFLLFLIFLSISSTFSLRIHCNFNLDSNWVIIGRVYTCDASILEITNDEIAYEGEHLPGYSSDDVKMIDFGINSNCSQLSAIPSDFLSIFPNFTAVYFINCGISFLSGSELENYENLEWFGLYRSALERIPGNLFQSTPRLRFVNFNSNQIARVGENLLENLENLERVYFNNNVCISKYATNSTGIEELVEVLRVNCADVETTTITTSDWCERGNSEERICLLEEENLMLRQKLEDLEERLRRLEDLIMTTTSTPDFTFPSA